MEKTISLDLAKANIENPLFFEGGVTVEKDGEPALFIMTAKEQVALFNELHKFKETQALMKLVAMSQQDIAEGRTYSLEEALERLKNQRM
ncbi:hypothetical protein D3C85_1192640 [compost metagenome]